MYVGFMVFLKEAYREEEELAERVQELLGNAPHMFMSRCTRVEELMFVLGLTEHT